MSKPNYDVLRNFDVSVIMPFYNRLESFKKTLLKNSFYLQRNGIEVIIVLDSPNEEQGIIDLIKEYPLINWRLIVNDNQHDPRNPAPVLNTGIRHAEKKYILISDPEVEFYTDVIYELRKLLDHYPRHYATGTVAFVEEHDIITLDNIESLWFLEYGSIMTQKKYLEEIRGYDENFKFWGGEDDNIRRRLDLTGIKKLHFPETKSLHREPRLRLKERLDRTNQFPAESLKKIYFPQKPVVNSVRWGREFDKISYDWKKNTHAKELCIKYLNSFLEYKICDDIIFTKSYNKIILAQSFNEVELIDGFLSNMGDHFDGIILLDDGSTDQTYENASHSKLLLKVKKSRTEFNDLENRNILLNIVSFIQTNWICFMDIDERFSIQYSNFNSFTSNEGIETTAFYFIDVWDDLNLYNESSPFSDTGIYIRPRMFRNIGRLQIITPKKKLHFAVTPYKGNLSIVPVLVKHLGTISKKDRIEKYNFYMREDVAKDQSDYKYLLDEDPKLKKIDDIKLF